MSELQQQAAEVVEGAATSDASQASETTDTADTTTTTDNDTTDTGDDVAGLAAKISNLEDENTRLHTMVADLRKENGRDRTAGKQAAVDNARTEWEDALAKALNVTPDGDAPLLDIVREHQARYNEAIRSLAVHARADALGASPSRLLDSVEFTRTLATVDPGDHEAVDKAIKAAIEARPELKAVSRIHGPTRLDHAAGTATQQRGEYDLRSTIDANYRAR